MLKRTTMFTSTGKMLDTCLREGSKMLDTRHREAVLEAACLMWCGLALFALIIVSGDNNDMN